MIVLKLLEANGDMDRPNGRFSIGILMFQSIWGIIMLALQPSVEHHEGLDIVRILGWSVFICVGALFYAKFVVPVVLLYSSKSVELMLVLALAWCFFVCCAAILPFINLSMELASLVAGMALAMFPFSHDFNSKIKFIRDFFITIFFAGLGMLIPVPTFQTLGMAVLVVVIILLSRMVSIFLIAVAVGGGKRLASLATINLSQLSEFGLIICMLGYKAGHVDNETMAIMIWAFAILAFCSTYMIQHNHFIFLSISRAKRHLVRKVTGEPRPAAGSDPAQEGEQGGSATRDILLLGFHRIAFMLIAECRSQDKSLLSRMHVIDFNKSFMPVLERNGIKCTYGDFSDDAVLHHAYGQSAPSLVLVTIPDSMLQGVTNLSILAALKKVFPTTICIMTADNPPQAAALYTAGADYVLRSAKLCAERLHGLLTSHSDAGSELANIFETFREKDKDRRNPFLSTKL